MEIASWEEWEEEREAQSRMGVSCAWEARSTVASDKYGGVSGIWL